MDVNESKELIRVLINKIYNSTNITSELLDEIKEDLKIISKHLQETKFSRELGVFIEFAKKQKTQVGKNNFKFLLLSNLEKRYQRLRKGE